MQTCKNTSWAALCTHKSELRPKAGNRQQEATSRQLVHTRAGRAGKAKSQVLSPHVLNRVARDAILILPSCKSMPDVC